ncbi:MAG: ATP-binding protein, partial [Cyanobacteria bacterium J06638_22]
MLECTPGINILIGKNNAGKTAFLEGLGLKLDSAPHRSIETASSRFKKLEDNSYAQITLSIEKEEIISYLEQIPEPIIFP